MPLPPVAKKLADTVNKKYYGAKVKETNKTTKKTAVKDAQRPKIKDAKSSLKEVASIALEIRPKKLTRTKSRARSIGAKPRLFVLDTNVLLHDPMSLFRFEEHDVFLPMTTLEELDNHKKGMSDTARNARQVSRWIDQLLEKNEGDIKEGIELNGIGNKEAHGRLFFQTSAINASIPEGLPAGKSDNVIIAVVRSLQTEYPEKSVVLVSKDINMRIKATALGIPAEDYFNDKTIDDTDLLYAGREVLNDTFWDDHAKALESWQAKGRTWYKITGPIVKNLEINEFVNTRDADFVAQVKAIESNTATLCTIRDYTLTKNAVWGINARNIEQSYALNLLLDPEIDFVTILGQAGTGKTLLTLAAALEQTLEDRRYKEIIFTRATVSVGEEIGYLPGTEEEKMQPWMGALEDNLEVLNRSEHTGGDWGRSAAMDLVRSRIRIKSMSFMRGRTFLNKFVIIDEAQNLSPKQMKTLITRAGPGTKIVCLGNIAQIDTPYLTEGSSGLTYVVDRLKAWEHSGHVTLQRGERSRLADYASEAL